VNCKIFTLRFKLVLFKYNYFSKVYKGALPFRARKGDHHAVHPHRGESGIAERQEAQYKLQEDAVVERYHQNSE
jgi:hypothetical protein